MAFFGSLLGLDRFLLIGRIDITGRYAVPTVYGPASGEYNAQESRSGYPGTRGAYKVLICIMIFLL